METQNEEVKNNTSTNGMGMDMEITSNTTESNEKIQMENVPIDGKQDVLRVVGNGSEKENTDMEDDITVNEEELNRLRLIYKKGVEEGVEEEKSRLKMEEKKRSEEEQKWKNGMQSVLVKVQQELEQMKQKTHETQKEPLKNLPIDNGSMIETIVSCASNGSNKPKTDMLSYLSLEKENKKVKKELKNYYKKKYKNQENQKKMKSDVNYSSKDEITKRKYEKVDEDYNAKILSFLNTNKKPMVEVNKSSKNSKNSRYDEKISINNESTSKMNNNDSLQIYNRNEELSKMNNNKYGGSSDFYNLVYNSNRLKNVMIESGENGKGSLSGYPRDNRSFLMNSIEVSRASLNGNNKQTQNTLAPMNALYNWVRTGDVTSLKKVPF